MGQNYKQILDETYEILFRRNRMTSRYLEIMGDSQADVLLMRLLLKHPQGICQKEICENLGMPKQTLSRILALEVRKNVLATETAQNDGRKKIYKLTEKGRKLAQEIVNKRDEKELEILKLLAPEWDNINKANNEYLNCYEEIMKKRNSQR